MDVTEPNAMGTILDQVKAWPIASRIRLARRILETVEGTPPIEPPVPQPSPGNEVGPNRTEAPPSNAGRTRGWPVERALGLLKTDRKPPDDDECRRIVEEERWKKYGG